MKRIFVLIMLFMVLLNVQTITAQEPIETDYLIIPSINLYKSIDMVPITNRTYDLTALGDGVVWAEGTIWNDTSWARTVLFGHTADTFGAFRRLHELQVGDLIIVTTETQVIEYVVFDMVVVDPSAVGWLSPTDQHELTLITCHDNAVTRLVVRAHLKN